MIEMVRRFLRQKYGSAWMILALVVLSLLTVISLLGPRSEAGPAGIALFLLAAGSVSRDVSSGALQMILSRPIRRTGYLFGRYLGILAAFAAFLAFTWLLTALLGTLTRATGQPLELHLGAAATDLLGEFVTGARNGGILLMFSTFLPGIADVLGYVLLQLVLNPPIRNIAVRDAIAAVKREVFPTTDWLTQSGLLSEGAGRYALALTVYLTIAAVVFSRRELPYGQD
ncbi:MAG: hypothetical protein ABI610_10155 [Acidobacteriota bacterium]